MTDADRDWIESTRKAAYVPLITWGCEAHRHTGLERWWRRRALVLAIVCMRVHRRAWLLARTW